jgi:hypothetical protein
MALALDTPFAAAAPARPTIRTGTFALGALASLGAGGIHAAAIGAHGEHRQAVYTFAVVALFQIGIGAVALVSNRKLVGAALALGNLALVGGWLLAKVSSSGIGFVDGLDTKEPVQWADGLAAGMAAVAVLVVVLAALRRWHLPSSDAITRVFALPVVALTLTGMVAAGQHTHSHGAAGDGHVHAAAVVPPTPFVPGQPINLGGVPGVTAAQQAQAENVLASTLYFPPHFADYKVAEAEGWFSIGDGVTGFEHFINPSTFDDGKILDPTAPESIVYSTAGGKRTLSAAMYMLPPGTTLADVPNIGGKLMQWHIHDNLCFSPTGHVAGLRAAGGPCPAGQVKGGENPMIHVWVTENQCGPFSALEGVGAGSIAPGETRLCDHVHGA